MYYIYKLHICSLQQLLLLFSFCTLNALWLGYVLSLTVSFDQSSGCILVSAVTCSNIKMRYLKMAVSEVVVRVLGLENLAFTSWCKVIFLI